MIDPDSAPVDNPTKREAQLLLSRLDKLVDGLRDHVGGVRPNIQDVSVVEDVLLVRSYAEQLRRAIEAGSSKDALRASNGARGISKGLGDRVWTEEQPWIGSAAFDIMQHAIRLHTLLVEELGGFDEAYGV